MSILSKKKQVFEEIAILKTTNEVAINKGILKNSLPSLSTKDTKDPFLFLVDLLIVVSGSDSINKSINKMISNIGNVDTSFKSKIKDELSSSLGGDKNNASLPTSITNGFKIHINKLDYNNDLFIKDGTPEHSLYLSPFQKNLQSALVTPNTKVPINSLLTAEYNNTNGYFTMHPTSTTMSHKDFLFGLVDQMQFSDTKTMITNTFSDLFNGKNLTKEQSILNQKIDILLNNILLEGEVDDSYFSFDGKNESTLINEKIETNYDFYSTLGSAHEVSTLSNTDLLASVTKNGNFTPSFFTDVIKNITTTTDQTNKQSVTNGFLNKFLVGFKNNIVKNYILSPQIMLVYSMASGSANDNVLNPITDIRNNKNIISCMIKSIMNSLMQSLFALLKKDLAKIVAGVTVLYVQESADKYKKIIQSLFKIKL